MVSRGWWSLCVAVGIACGGEDASNPRGQAGSSGAGVGSKAGSGGTTNAGGSNNPTVGGSAKGGGNSAGQTSGTTSGLSGAGAGTAQAGEGSGAAGAAGAAGADVGPGGCEVSSQTRFSRSARSAGFSGTYQGNYYPLYDESCVVVGDCTAACVAAGGTAESCAASECIDSSESPYCLPPTYWFDFDRLLVEASTIESSAWIIMVNNPYRDTLIATKFQFEIPSEATIEGVAFAVNRSADSANMVGDFSVRAVRSGQAAGLDRAHSAPWSATFASAEYGGSEDLWGEEWSTADVNASDFGVALTPMYLDTAGNARAYVDFVEATVYFSMACPDDP